ncbi:MAG: hypothetical protein EPO26_14600 [Chloroflexota bacterium]|nr:MAG: hypothetical protein EPO26_14600 [Chloroflexota bacterium]
MLTPVAIILAGGANRRFWPLTQKSLLSFGNDTLLDRRIDELARAGFSDVILVANPDNADRMREAASRASGRAHVVIQAEPFGMGDAVLQCATLLEGLYASSPVFVNQVHDLVDPAIFRTIRGRLDADDADAFVVGVRLDRYFPGGYLSVSGDLATSVVEKPPPGTEPSNLMKIVADLVREPHALLTALRAVNPNPSDQYEQAWAQLMANRRVRIVSYDGPWVPIKYAWDVLRATALILDGLPAGLERADDVVIHPHATVSGHVRLGRGVKIFAGGAVVGPAIIGDGTIIGNGALVRGSIVGARCIVGFGAEIARSYVGNGCEFHTNYVGDSVLGDDVAFGSGTVTANLRLDERSIRIAVDGSRVDTGMTKIGALIGAHARTGINVSLMPGVRIGSGSAVGPGVHLHRDVPNGRLVTARQDLEDRPNPFTIDGDGRGRFRNAIRNASSAVEKHA